MATSRRVLTPDDVAKSLTRSMLRTTSILMDTRQIDPEFYEAVRHSRFYSLGLDNMLATEIALWCDRADTREEKL